MEKLALIAAAFVAALVMIYLSAKKQEEYKFLKLLGYFFISTLGIKTANFVVPTGIIFAGLIILRDRSNMVAKILASLLGLVVIVLFYTVGK